MAIYELRTYQVKTGRLADYLALFETRGIPIISRYAGPCGFWSTGPTESGTHDQVHHIWRYESPVHRIAQRAALYADPAWFREFVPHAMELFAALKGRLMVLDAARQESFDEVLAAKEPRGHVVARFSPAGTQPAADDAPFGRWRFITGEAGATFSLYFLDAIDLAAARWEGPCDIEVWRPTRFSAIR